MMRKGSNTWRSVVLQCWGGILTKGEKTLIGADYNRLDLGSKNNRKKKSLSNHLVPYFVIMHSLLHEKQEETSSLFLPNKTLLISFPCPLEWFLTLMMPNVMKQIVD
jgi:hypothetical protein